MFRVIPLLTLAISTSAWSGELTIKVANIKYKGVLYAAVYDEKKSLSRTKVITVNNVLE